MTNKTLTPDVVGLPQEVIDALKNATFDYKTIGTFSMKATIRAMTDAEKKPLQDKYRADLLAKRKAGMSVIESQLSTPRPEMRTIDFKLVHTRKEESVGFPALNYVRDLVHGFGWTYLGKAFNESNQRVFLFETGWQPFVYEGVQYEGREQKLTITEVKPGSWAYVFKNITNAWTFKDLVGLEDGKIVTKDYTFTPEQLAEMWGKQNNRPVPVSEIREMDSDYHMMTDKDPSTNLCSIFPVVERIDQDNYTFDVIVNGNPIEMYQLGALRTPWGKYGGDIVKRILINNECTAASSAIPSSIFAGNDGLCQIRQYQKSDPAAQQFKVSELYPQVDFSKHTTMRIMIEFLPAVWKQFIAELWIDCNTGEIAFKPIKKKS